MGIRCKHMFLVIGRIKCKTHNAKLVDCDLINMLQDFAKRGGLFQRNRAINGSLNFINRFLQRLSTNGVTSNCSPGCSSINLVIELADLPKT